VIVKVSKKIKTAAYLHSSLTMLMMNINEWKMIRHRKVELPKGRPATEELGTLLAFGQVS
jgi:hypothetical protein